MKSGIQAALIVSALLVFGAPASAQTASMTLEWDPSPSDVIGYRVYVGIEPGVYFATYDIPNQTRFVFMEAQLGALYYFAVAARGEHERVSALSNEVSGTAQNELFFPEPPDGIRTDFDNVVETLAERGARCQRDCSSALLVAQGPGAVTALAAAPDGRLFYVENEQTIGIAQLASTPPAGRRHGGSSDPLSANGTVALRMTDGTSLRAIALAPDFATSGSVFVAEGSPSARLARELRIVRYRAVDTTLGDGASVIAGLPGTQHGAVPLAPADSGSVFVAPPVDPASGNRRDPYAGHVLAFAPDGRTRPEDGATAPVIAPAGASPIALFWDRAGTRLWLASRDHQSLVRIDVAPGRQGTVSAVVPLPVRPVAASFSPNGDRLDVAVISEAGHLMAGSIDPNGRLESLDEIALPIPGRPTAIAFSEAREIFAAVTENGRWSLVRVR